MGYLTASEKTVSRKPLGSLTLERAALPLRVVRLRLERDAGILLRFAISSTLPGVEIDRRTPVPFLRSRPFFQSSWFKPISALARAQHHAEQRPVLFPPLVDRESRAPRKRRCSAANRRRSSVGTIALICTASCVVATMSLLSMSESSMASGRPSRIVKRGRGKRRGRSLTRTEKRGGPQIDVLSFVAQGRKTATELIDVQREQLLNRELAARISAGPEGRSAGASLRTVLYVLATAVCYYVATQVAWALTFPRQQSLTLLSPARRPRFHSAIRSHSAVVGLYSRGRERSFSGYPAGALADRVRIELRGFRRCPECRDSGGDSHSDQVSPQGDHAS